MADQLVEATAVAGRRDHRIGLYAGTVRQQDITLVEADDRGDNLDAPGPEHLDEPVVVTPVLGGGAPSWSPPLRATVGARTG